MAFSLPDTPKITIFEPNLGPFLRRFGRVENFMILRFRRLVIEFERDIERDTEHDGGRPAGHHIQNNWQSKDCNYAVYIIWDTSVYVVVESFENIVFLKIFSKENRQPEGCIPTLLASYLYNRLSYCVLPNCMKFSEPKTEI